MYVCIYVCIYLFIISSYFQILKILPSGFNQIDWFILVIYLLIFIIAKKI